jgi:ABC-type polysaccharide/polyol phosphate export permease
MRANQTTLSLSPFISRLVGTWKYGFMLESLVVREIRVRYRRSVLGIFWTLLNPILMMIIFSVVFSTLFQRQLVHFPVYFLSAHLAWGFFASTSTQAMSSMLRSAVLYKRVSIPKYVFVLAAVFAGLINFLLALIPLAGLILLLRHQVTMAIFFVPLALIVLVTFTVGVSFIVATVAVFFDDITQFYSVILQALMYLTAIFYPIDIVPGKYRILIELNPMYHIVQMIRIPIYYGTLPPALTIAAGVLSAVTVLVVGVFIFTRLSDRFVYYV